MLSRFLNLSFTDTVFISDMCDHIVPMLSQMPLALAVTLLENLGKYSHFKVFHFLRNVCQVLLQRYEELTPSNKKSIMSALARCDYYPDNPLVEKIYRDVAENQEQYTFF